MADNFNENQLNLITSTTSDITFVEQQGDYIQVKVLNQNGDVINLDSEQYYDYVTIINRDNDGNGYSDLLDAMQKKMESSTWQRHENNEDGPQRGKQLQMLLSVVEGFREDALKELKTVYTQISIGIENLKKKKELMGKK